MHAEELNPYDVGMGYAHPNEHIRIFMRYLAKTKSRPSKVLSICSGGEVPLLCFLPRAEEVLAIDHAKRSLQTALAKFHLIQAQGPERFLKLLKGTWRDFEPLWIEALKSVPKHLQYSGYSGSCSSSLNSYSWETFKQFWQTVPAGYLKVASKRLDKLSVIHGDLLDAAPRGPFDVIYLSNAFEHISRDHKYLANKHNQVLSMLKPNGMLLLTVSTSIGYGPRLKDTTRIAGPRTSFSCTWTYEVLHKREMAA